MRCFKLKTTWVACVAASALFLQPAMGVASPADHAFVEKLDHQVTRYECPTHDPLLQAQLTALMENPDLLKQICHKNSSPAQCRSGAFSLSNEAQGLANLAQKARSSDCPIAQETKTQLSWYLQQFLAHQ